MREKHNTFHRIVRRLRRAYRTMDCRLRDRQMGIVTKDRFSSNYIAEISARNRPNEGIGFGALDIVFSELQIVADDVVFDIGCGFGRTLCYAARKGFRAVGIEIRDDVAEVAQRNVRTLKQPHEEIKIINGDATQQNYKDASVIFMYNPFDAEVMRSVLDLIKNHRRGKKVCIAYVNPTEKTVLNEVGWLRQTKSFSVPYRGGKMLAEVWDGIPP